METIFRKLILLFLILTLPSLLIAQYWGERVLEKGFEQTDFFFTPVHLNPYGIGSFNSTTAGLLDDPLLNLSMNPALVRVDSMHFGYFYTDFRSAKTILDQNSPSIAPWLDYRSTSLALYPYPYIYTHPRRELEPVFSGAYIGPPLPAAFPHLILGVTYQFILQDDKYYDVPQDIYRSVIGADYAGNKVAASSSLPIVDRYSGEDNMHQKGHFISVLSKYEIPDIGSLGIKVGRVLFDRSGAFGSSNLWGTPIQTNSSSLWSNLESRSQNYSHWEVTGGTEVYVDDKTTIGATAGWLWGQATQSLHNNDSSNYNYSSAPYASYYVNSGNTQENWNHDGHTLLLGFDVTSHLTSNHTLRFLYQRQQSTIDIGLGTGILDTSYSTYTYVYLDTARTNTSYSFLRDQRNGSGRQRTTTNRMLASLQWQIDDCINLAMGVQLNWQTTETNTSEDVLANMASMYQSNYGYYWNYGTDQSKDLQWTFSAEKTSFQIPIFLTIKASDAIDVLLGLNRSMTHSKIEDQTLAVFRYRVSNNNGTVTHESNFGERYTTPTEEVSDVRTTFLAGITAAASSHFKVRLLVVPNFRDTYEGSKLDDLRWWISLNIIP